MMATVKHQVPCGCIVLTDTDGIVTDVRRCPPHQHAWNEGIALFARRIDEEAADRIYRDVLGLTPRERTE